MSGRLGLGNASSQDKMTSENWISSMANLAEAREDGGVFDEGGSLAARIDSLDRKVTSGPLGTLDGKSERRGVDGGSDLGVEVLTDDARTSENAGDDPVKDGQSHLRDGDVADFTADTPGYVGQNRSSINCPATETAEEEEKHLVHRGESFSATETLLLSRPVSSKEQGVPKPEQGFAGCRTVVSMEDVAATRIQATCRRHAAQKVFRNKRRSAGEGKLRSPVCGGGRVTTEAWRAPAGQQPIVEKGGRVVEEECTASLIQKTHRRAAAIRRARAEHKRSFQNQQFSFGPGFQQPARRTTRDRDTGTEGSSKGSEGQNRARSEPSLTTSEEEEKQKKSTSRAAIKIQTQARCMAASRRVAAARQRRAVATRREAAMAAAAAAPVPRLPIGSLSSRSSSDGRGGNGGDRVAPKFQREPLAILRQLRGEAEFQLKPQTDQLRLRMTIKSAIEAHIKKSGAARRKPRPLPTVPSWRQSFTATKLKLTQQQQRAAMAAMPLAKPRAISPLHRSVRQVNRFMATDRQRRQPWTAVGPRGRPRSAPAAAATGRLRCAIFSAEAVVEREYVREERRKYCAGDDNAPVDELSRDLLASPLLVPYQS